MKHKLQSSIFLQPIDQHFLNNKISHFPEQDEISYFNECGIKFDYLNHSTDSDSGESKRENDYFLESGNVNLRKISQIGERSKEKFLCENFSGNHSQKNFHVPNFLLADSSPVNFEPGNFSAESDKSLKESIRLGSDTSLNMLRFSINEINISNLRNSNKNNSNKLKKCFNEISNLNLKNEDEVLEEEEVPKHMKIGDFLHTDWESKLRAQKFLKFSAYKKKIFEQTNNNNKKSCNKKNKKNNSRPQLNSEIANSNSNKSLEQNNNNNNSNNNLNNKKKNSIKGVQLAAPIPAGNLMVNMTPSQRQNQISYNQGFANYPLSPQPPVYLENCNSQQALVSSNNYMNDSNINQNFSLINLRRNTIGFANQNHPFNNNNNNTNNNNNFYYNDFNNPNYNFERPMPLKFNLDHRNRTNSFPYSTYTENINTLKLSNNHPILINQNTGFNQPSNYYN